MADNYIARKDTQWLIISLVPDVCKTPMGSATPPIPYPVIAKLEDASAPVSSVRANGQPVVVFGQSFVPQTLGDEAGTATGVKSGTVGGKCHPKEHTQTVRADGKLTLRHTDKFWMNGA
ncbi:DUF4150 domain-containing protein [Xenorhabdus bovienii]|uniref:DUF4150 domain-containing protein n=1 Tax=Xenorhabdus bovienii TaxID=40576 RepID=UPI0023B22F08|nr:DUF4150 domain-containing protein [Xenorhabdus bovienii]MDE9430799.1 DUF4150 domain-containing protein [Xenorhabdus bovienii]MDE9488442.1 DUF4150 domain-containing protein [Xenorhabdus bovienii]MDE9504821.1 DUF4150 domain-containing protein [Xenorhabdus bovienii]MDE9546271.1 DUF4150 domain-containing protein [Xenorhabdus bovienii]